MRNLTEEELVIYADETRYLYLTDYQEEELVRALTKEKIFQPSMEYWYRQTESGRNMYNKIIKIIRYLDMLIINRKLEPNNEDEEPVLLNNLIATIDLALLENRCNTCFEMHSSLKCVREVLKMMYQCKDYDYNRLTQQVNNIKKHINYCDYEDLLMKFNTL